MNLFIIYSVNLCMHTHTTHLTLMIPGFFLIFYSEVFEPEVESWKSRKNSLRELRMEFCILSGACLKSTYWTCLKNEKKNNNKNNISNKFVSRNFLLGFFAFFLFEISTYLKNIIIHIYIIKERFSSHFLQTKICLKILFRCFIIIINNACVRIEQNKTKIIKYYSILWMLLLW